MVNFCVQLFRPGNCCCLHAAVAMSFSWQCVSNLSNENTGEYNKNCIFVQSKKRNNNNAKVQMPYNARTFSLVALAMARSCTPLVAAIFSATTMAWAGTLSVFLS